MDRLTVADVKQSYLKRIARKPKLRSYIRLLFGKYLWQPIDAEEFLERADGWIKIADGVTTEEELKVFCKTKLSEYLEPNSVQWRIFVFEDYSPNNSVILIQCHGSLYSELSRIIKIIKPFNPDKAPTKPKELWPEQRVTLN